MADLVVIKKVYCDVEDCGDCTECEDRTDCVDIKCKGVTEAFCAGCSDYSVCWG